jgi:hypothetical protein
LVFLLSEDGDSLVSVLQYLNSVPGVVCM